MDHPRQPGAQPEPGARLRAGRHRRAGCCCWPRRWSRPACSAIALQGTVLATTKGEKLGGIQFRHPLAQVDKATTGSAPVYLADYATAEDGTGIVHSSPAYGLDDFNSCVAHGMTVDDILNPVQGNGAYAADFPLFGGLSIWKAVPKIIEALKDAGRLFAHRDHHPQLPALLAPQDAGDLPRRGAVVHPHGRRRRRVHQGQGAEDLAPDGAGGDRRDRVLPRERPRTSARHDRQPPRLVHQPAAQLGRAAAVLPAQVDSGEPHPRHDGDHRPRRRDRRARRHRGLEPRRRPKRSSARKTRQGTIARAPTSSRSGSTRARPSSTCCAARTAGRR